MKEKPHILIYIMIIAISKLFYSHHFGVIGFVALWLLYYSI